VRLSEIVNTLTAYQMLQAGLSGRNVNASSKAASSGAGYGLAAQPQAQSDGLEWLDENDSVELSGGRALGAEDEQDDSLGAIVEGFIRQRQTYAFTIPGVKGVSSPISVTWEVEEAYHVIQFVPAGSMVDTQA